ncbi:hypothetical protein [Phenylobacterium sp.]|jgi:hemoglobin-like flavoprotein|uniref:hypothetical protein n=1 Tax=Phenylobacterium sp. TaxID=1871053 RepID=UPI002F958064
MSGPVEQSLQMLAERAGDPAHLVYRRLFAELPHTEPLFAHDDTGAIRGEMLAIAFQCLMEPEGAYTANLVRAERANHDGWGVEAADFPRFFPIVRDVCREVLGEAWTAEFDTAWSEALASLDTASRT